MIVKNDLFDYQDRFIYQDDKLFKFSLDSILLAEFTRNYINDKMNILDLCAGNMAVVLIISKYSKSIITGFEIQKRVFELGQKSIEINDLSKQLYIINDDVKNIGSYYNSEYFDVMVCNPPFFKVGSSLKNEQEDLSIARHEISITLEDIFIIAKSYLKNKGNLIIIHRANRLDEIINLAVKYQINVKNIQLVTTKNGKKPSIVIINAVKNSKCGVIINRELCVQDVKSYQNIFKE